MPFNVLLVISAAIWIIGLSIVLAVLSNAYYHAQTSRNAIGAWLRQPLYRLGVYGGLLLTAVGFGLGNQVIWQRLLWFVLAAGYVYFLVVAVLDWQRSRQGNAPDDHTE